MLIIIYYLSIDASTLKICIMNTTTHNLCILCTTLSSLSTKLSPREINNNQTPTHPPHTKCLVEINNRGWWEFVRNFQYRCVCSKSTNGVQQADALWTLSCVPWQQIPVRPWGTHSIRILYGYYYIYIIRILYAPA